MWAKVSDSLVYQSWGCATAPMGLTLGNPSQATIGTQTGDSVLNSLWTQCHGGGTPARRAQIGLSGSLTSMKEMQSSDPHEISDVPNSVPFVNKKDSVMLGKWKKNINFADHYSRNNKQ